MEQKCYYNRSELPTTSVVVVKSVMVGFNHRYNFINFKNKSNLITAHKHWSSVFGRYLIHYYRVMMCPKTFRPKWSFIILVP
jgi:hypothetical protein